MEARLVLVHTLQPLVDLFNNLGVDMLPGVQLLHVLDEPLIEHIRQRGCLAAEDSMRLWSHVSAAERVGAGAVLVTCSTVSPCVDDVLPRASIPVMKIDEAMIARAVLTGSRIGVVATASSTLVPTNRLLRAQARTSGKEIITEAVLVENALSALLAGDSATHDDLVRRAVLEVAQRVDVVILAQASMARVLNVIPKLDRVVPVLSSPHLALKRVGQLLRGAH